MAYFTTVYGYLKQLVDEEVDIHEVEDFVKSLIIATWLISKEISTKGEVNPEEFSEKTKVFGVTKAGLVNACSTLSDKGFLLSKPSRVPSPKKETTLKEEFIFREPKPFDVYKTIEKIMCLAKNEVKIMDPYVDKSLFPLYFSDVMTKVTIKILTMQMFDKFKEVAKKFKQQKENFEVRSSEEVHDRYLIVDDRVWMLGQSLKDAGKKPLTIIEVEDAQAITDIFNRLWNKSPKII